MVNMFLKALKPQVFLAKYVVTYPMNVGKELKKMGLNFKLCYKDTRKIFRNCV